MQDHRRAPGSAEAEYDKDLGEMVALAKQVLGELPANTEMVSNACAEM